jgi:hypothetical protein
VLVCLLACASAAGCASFGWFEDEPVPLEIGTTPDEITAQIAAERSRLLDLLNAPLPDDAHREAQRKIMVGIAARLTRLEHALAEFDTTDDQSVK